MAFLSRYSFSPIENNKVDEAEEKDDIIEGSYKSLDEVESIILVSNKDNILSKLPNLKKIVFDDDFNKSIIVPDTVEHLDINWNYWNRKIEIPPSVKYLSVGPDFALANKVPRTVDTLHLKNFDELDVTFYFK
jgi:hypothetical protein